MNRWMKLSALALLILAGFDAAPEAKYQLARSELVARPAEPIAGPACPGGCADLQIIGCDFIEQVFFFPTWSIVTNEYTGPGPILDVDDEPYRLCVGFPEIGYSVCESNATDDVAPAPIPNYHDVWGDFDHDCDCDAADIAIWESLGGAP
jgi:hypothetical protein